MWLHILLVLGGLIAGAFIGATIGVVGFGALLAACKSEVPVPQLQVPEVPMTQELSHLPTITTQEWRKRECKLRWQ